MTTTVEVSADLPVIETGRTNAYNNVYTSREVQNIPVPGRSFLDLFVVNPIVNAPPISTGGSGTGTPSVSFGGLGFRAINVDGVSTGVYNTTFAVGNAAASRLVNGWALTARTVAQSGLPFSPDRTTMATSSSAIVPSASAITRTACPHMLKQTFASRATFT